MKVALVSDIHGNMTALNAVHEEVKSEVDGYVMLGDYVGLLGSPSDVIAFAMEKSLFSIKGNHDIAVVENGEGHVNSEKLSEFELSLADSQLSENQEKWVGNLDSYNEVPEYKFVMAHAYPSPMQSTGLEPRNPGLTKGNYTKAASEFEDDKYNFIFIGHTHNQSKLDCKKFGNDIKVVNPGSVGQPMSKSEAEYAVIDLESGGVKLEKVEYDNSKVISKLEENDVPLKWWK